MPSFRDIETRLSNLARASLPLITRSFPSISRRYLRKSNGLMVMISRSQLKCTMFREGSEFDPQFDYVEFCNFFALHLALQSLVCRLYCYSVPTRYRDRCTRATTLCAGMSTLLSTLLCVARAKWEDLELRLVHNPTKFVHLLFPGRTLSKLPQASVTSPNKLALTSTIAAISRRNSCRITTLVRILLRLTSINSLR